jgi:hypothetical protein
MRVLTVAKIFHLSTVHVSTQWHTLNGVSVRNYSSFVRSSVIPN